MRGWAGARFLPFLRSLVSPASRGKAEEATSVPVGTVGMDLETLGEKEPPTPGRTEHCWLRWMVASTMAEPSISLELFFSSGAFPLHAGN